MANLRCRVSTGQRSAPGGPSGVHNEDERVGVSKVLVPNRAQPRLASKVPEQQLCMVCFHPPHIQPHSGHYGGWLQPRRPRTQLLQEPALFMVGSDATMAWSLIIIRVCCPCCPLRACSVEKHGILNAAEAWLML